MKFMPLFLRSIPEPYDFYKEQERDNTKYLDGQKIQLSSYRDIYNQGDATTKQWLFEHVPPWTFSRIINLMQLENEPLPSLQCVPFPYKGSGEYRPIGRIMINSDIRADTRIFHTLYDSIVSVFVHELQHHKQFIEKRLCPINSLTGVLHTYWEGTPFRISYRPTQEEYNNLPWEKEANMVAYDVVGKLIQEGHVKHYFEPQESIYAYYERTQKEIAETRRKAKEDNTVPVIS